MTTSYETIVLGAGVNGLVAAAHLAKRGQRILCVDQRKLHGGMAGSIDLPSGHRAPGLLSDCGAFWPSVVDGLGLEQFGLKLTRERSPYFVPQIRGPGLLIQTNVSATCREIGKHSAADAAKATSYFEFMDRLRPGLQELFQNAAPRIENFAVKDLWEYLKLGIRLRRLGRRDLSAFLRFAPMSLCDFLGDWFESSFVKCALARPALSQLYAGPWSPGTAMNLILWETLSSCSIDGGTEALIQSLVKAGQASGVDFRMESKVEKILVRENRIDGIKLQSGDEITCQTVLSTVSPKNTVLCLLDTQDVPYAWSKEIHEFRSRGVSAYVGLELEKSFDWNSRPGLEVDQIFLNESLIEQEKAFDDCKYGRISQNPILDISSRSEGDSTTLGIRYQYAPYQLRGGWSESSRKELLDRTLVRLESFSKGVQSKVRSSVVLTPEAIEEDFGVMQGHLHHGEHSLDQLMVRPGRLASHYGTPIPGLYLGGSGSHPGGGITGGPGFLSASRILKDLGKARS